MPYLFQQGFIPSFSKDSFHLSARIYSISSAHRISILPLLYLAPSSYIPLSPLFLSFFLPPPPPPPPPPSTLQRRVWCWKDGEHKEGHPVPGHDCRVFSSPWQGQAAGSQSQPATHEQDWLHRSPGRAGVTASSGQPHPGGFRQRQDCQE